MDPIIVGLFSLAINCVFGVGMYFMKSNHENIKERLAKTESAIDHIKDHYFKKEDFREFKEELWVRLDRMENSFESKLKLFNEKN